MRKSEAGGWTNERQVKLIRTEQVIKQVGNIRAGSEVSEMRGEVSIQKKQTKTRLVQGTRHDRTQNTTRARQTGSQRTQGGGNTRKH